MPSLTISKDYLNREARRKNPVENWIIAYCTRNKIKHYLTCRRQLVTPYDSEDISYLFLGFKSDWQMQCFLRRARQRFPYFEFL